MAEGVLPEQVSRRGLRDTTWLAARTALGLALALVAFEPLLRAFHYAPMVWHSTLGPIYQPGSVVTFRREGAGRSSWQDDGLRRAEPLPARGDRVVVLGDSFVEALMIDDDQVLTAVAESHLSRQLPGVSVLNLGRASGSAADYVALAPWIRKTFAPTWAVVELQNGDIEFDAVNESKTHFRVSAGGQLEVVMNVQRGALWQALLPLRRRSSVLDLAISRLPGLMFPDDDAPLFRAAAPPAGAQAFDTSVTRGMLDELRSAYSGRLTILFLPSFEPAGPESIVPAEATVVEWSRATGTSLVNLRTSFPRFRTAGRAPYGFANTTFNEGHLNADGHAAAGELLADELWTLHHRGLF